MTTMSSHGALTDSDTRTKARVSWSFICVMAFVGIGYICQLLLLLPDFGGTRVIWRSLSFVTSIAMLGIMRRAGTRRHPAIALVLTSLLIVALGLLHPDTSSFKGGFAHLLFYICLMVPLLWAGGCDISVGELRWVLITIWVFNSASAAVGVLQVEFPGDFQPNLSSVIESQQYGADALKITLADGTSTFRPMGLSDQPGGSAIASLIAIVISIGLLLNEKSWFLKAMCYASIACSIFSVYLSQMRVIMVMIMVCLSAFTFAMIVRGEFARVTKITASLAAVIVLATLWAFTKGGESVQDRFLSLFEDSATSVYYEHRGFFLEATLYQLVPQYPFGAGLARWGMMSYYFGTEGANASLWAEIGWTGWLYDGGIPLMISFAGAVLVAIWVSWRIATTRSNGAIGLWATVIFAYSVGGFAMSFSGHFFLSSMGMEFWMLQGLLFSAAFNGNKKLLRINPIGSAAIPFARNGFDLAT